MPSERPIHHVGITVANLERSIDFYCRVLDGTVVRPPYEFSERDNRQVAHGVGMDGATVKTAFISAANTLIEFLEYENPRGRPYELRNADVGAMHVCIHVDDIDEVHRRLSDEGVTFLSEVSTLQDGAVSGAKWVYARDPDNICLEFVQTVAGMDV